MKRTFSLLLFLISFFSFGFTHLSSSRPKFPISEITYNVANNNCTNAGFTATALLDQVEIALDRYWNSVATSSIKLKKGSVLNIDIDGDTGPGVVAQKGEDNTILIGCNNDYSSFTSGTQGVATIICYTNGNCRGGVIINDASVTLVDTMTDAEVSALIAHEVGHSLGLGHVESDKVVALMNPSLDGKNQEFLTQDDIDGITHFYPNEKKLGGLLGSCATVSLVNDDDDIGPGGAAFILSLLLGLSLIMLMKRFQDILKEDVGVV